MEGGGKGGGEGMIERGIYKRIREGGRGKGTKYVRISTSCKHTLT